MKKLVFLFSLVALFAIAASAGTVTFSTTGAFSCGGLGAGCVLSNTNQTVSYQGVTLVYAPTSTTITAPTFTNLGTITSSCPSCNSTSALNGISLTITINQTVPSVGSGSFSAATITGAITAQGTSTAILSFNAPNYTTGFGTAPGVVINTVTYQGFTTQIVAPSSGQVPGQSTIQGAVTDTPEPLTFGLVGLGLGLVGMLRRRAA